MKGFSVLFLQSRLDLSEVSLVSILTEFLMFGYLHEQNGGNSWGLAR